jgi:predicted TIM-barrel fold metal-dependent hydrolase
MPYVPDGQVIHDADAHVVETPDWFAAFADPDIAERLELLYVSTVQPGEDDLIEHYRKRHADPEFRADDAAEIMLRKNWKATGSFIKQDRPAALDLLGFATQLLFNTFANKALLRAEHGDDLDYAYGLARAHNRAMVDFCDVDARLLPVGYVPLRDFERTKAFTAEAIELGCKALMIASACPATHSPSHVGLDPFWAQAAEAGVPVVFHVGGGGTLLDPNYFENGLPPVPDFHGGDGNFRSVDYMAIPYPVMQTLATLVIDGVLDRFPTLKLGVIEQGAAWLPGLMRSLDSAQDAFHRNEERLQRLELKASEYVLRQVRVTPYPHEDAGWVIGQTGPQVCLFSSDYPHVEGGRNPLKRFGASLDAHAVDDDARDAFYRRNFEDLMGPALSGAYAAAVS